MSSTPGTALVTGGHGFLGKAVASQLKRDGFRVVGIGRGGWSDAEALAQGFDTWLAADVTLPSLTTLEESFDLVVHCAGNGSVGHSVTHPWQDFHKTVVSTADLLEYLRLRGSRAMLVYPSSAGVYGAKADAPIRETAALEPISPYGFHKKMVEDLLASYSASYGLRIAIVRFFSVYGPSLTKQLLWDAGAKLRAAHVGPAVFWGTGEETRDWISVDDAAKLIVAAASSGERFSVLNGASGERVTVRKTIELLRSALGVEAGIDFNNAVREGDPRFYHADIGRAMALGWRPSTSLSDGIARYARWLIEHEERPLD